MKDLNEFQKQSVLFADDCCDRLDYLALALCGEAGEVAEKVKKIFRDQNGCVFAEDAKALAYELGDCLWYVSVTANKLGYKLSDIAEMNRIKIISRAERNMLHGSGDNR